MMHWVQYLISAFYFISVLSVLVIVHEWGHFIVAKMCGMRVDDFSLFFGKRLWRIGKWNGTEYNIRSVPIGGFVKIAGMEPEDISNGAPLLGAFKGQSRQAFTRYLVGLDQESLATVNIDNVSERIKSTVIESVGADGRLTNDGVQNLNALLPSMLNDDERRYLEAVLATVTFLPDPTDFNQKPLWQRAAAIFAGPAASLLFGYFVFCAMGVTLGLFTMGNTVETVSKDKPAARAGIKPGDTIVSINGTPVEDGEKLVEIIHNNPGIPVQLIIQRKGESIPITATPDKINVGGKIEGRLGFGPGSMWKRYSPAVALAKGTEIFVFQVKGIFQIFSRPKEMGENIGGPIAIATVIHEGGQRGINNIILMGATLSISLGILNLLPIPILDGGHLLLLAIEGLRRRKLSSREVYAAQMFGLSIIGMIFVFVMVNDIRRLFH